jgi:ribosomal protein S18 acetylase RimI-like enzyme
VSAGQVVGWCDVVPNPRPIFAHVGLLGMAVLPEFRRQGLGGRLIRQTLDAARKFGLRRVELTVRESNTVAIELYRKIGFTTEGLHRDRIRLDGAYENQMFMGLLF